MRLTNLTDFEQMGGGTSAPAHLLTAQSMSTGQSGQNPSSELRATVERRFMRMNEAHDRIRMTMLCNDNSKTK